jgi:subtilisin family serine protease
MRWLVQVDKTRLEAVRQQLGGLGLPVVSQQFNFITVEIPDPMVERVRALPGVVAMTPEKTYKTLPVLPVEAKLAEFHRLFMSNPLTGPAMAFKFALEADAGKTRVPTSESRKMVGADVAEGEGISGKGIKVAVLDTGTSYDLLFQGAYAGGRSAVEGQLIPYDEVGHGTHVQSTISGKPFQSIHGLLKGVAVDAEVIAIKCLGYGLGMGSTSAILRGMADAVEWGADVVSMSLGGSEEAPGNPYDVIISGLSKEGMIFCIAAGNSGPDPETIGTPGSCEAALTVGAVDIQGNIADFSSRGRTKDGRIKPDVVAPGVNILSTSAGYIALMQFRDGPPALAAISGTSMATPHCTGVVALAQQYSLQKRGRKLTTDEVKEAMTLYGDRAGAKDLSYGWGLLTYSILKRYVDEKLS